MAGTHAHVGARVAKNSYDVTPASVHFTSQCDGRTGGRRAPPAGGGQADTPAGGGQGNTLGRLCDCRGRKTSF
jgi:hypothetical protein